MEMSDFQKKKLEFHDNALKYYKEPLTEKQIIRKEFMQINKLRKRRLEIQKNMKSKDNYNNEFRNYDYYINNHQTIYNKNKLTEEMIAKNIEVGFELRF